MNFDRGNKIGAGTGKAVVEYGLSNIEWLYLSVVPRILGRETNVVQKKFNRHDIVFI